MKEFYFTSPYATLSNYQKTLIHKSEQKVNPTLINDAIIVYKLRTWTIITYRSIDSLTIQFCS